MIYLPTSDLSMLINVSRQSKRYFFDLDELHRKLESDEAKIIANVILGSQDKNTLPPNLLETLNGIRRISN